MKTLRERGISQLEEVRQRAARDYAQGRISKKLLDDVDDMINGLVEKILEETS